MIFMFELFYAVASEAFLPGEIKKVPHGMHLSENIKCNILNLRVLFLPFSVMVMS